MKKILFLAACDIAKRSGAGLATLAYYNAICLLRPNNVDLLMPEEFCYGKNSVIPVPKRSKVKAILSGSLHRYKSFVLHYLRKYFSQYDICILNGGLYAGDLIDIIHSFNIKVMVIHHNFEREYHMDNNSILTLKGITPFFINRIEKKAYRGADVNCFLTKSDEVLFKKAYGKSTKPSHIIGVFEPDCNNLPKPSKEKSEKIIAITGSMDSVQTMIGIKDLRDNYLDIILRLFPDWKIIIAGRDPKEEVYNLRTLHPSRITVVANPENMGDITSKASIFLCPTNVGGGLKLRVMDGLRQGLPVIAHAVSTRGYDLLFDKPYFKIYNDRASFEKGLSELVEFCQIGYDRQVIQDDYLNYFGFNQGLDRIKLALEDLKCQ